MSDKKKLLAWLHCHLRCGVVFSWLSAVRLWALPTTSLNHLCAPLCIFWHQFNSLGSTVIGFGRGGRRGSSQKTAYIRGGLQQGFLSNSYPFILDESELGRANFRKPAIQKEYEAQHPSAASPSQSVRPRLEENPKTFNLASAPGAGGTCAIVDTHFRVCLSFSGSFGFTRSHKGIKVLVYRLASSLQSKPNRRRSSFPSCSAGVCWYRCKDGSVGRDFEQVIVRSNSFLRRHRPEGERSHWDLERHRLQFLICLDYKARSWERGQSWRASGFHSAIGFG